ncbi:GGDEF domain-containing protein [Vibrio sinaloensis]|uniref:GGDEF domain-containing protein n=1 Tax=Photobacterium sp. (strain ATCC 43367) TaxID=379097 RepID=UPI00057F4F2B|nr:GGDEF domain-containing protein [Vibrio sinaloensis]KHT51206.1 diguanylate cyclase [Vibrio sinaloensis]
MGNFVGRHLEEMADLRSSRKHKVVQICSIVSIAILLVYSTVHFLNGSLLFAVFNLGCTVILLLNLWFGRHQQARFNDLILSGVLLLQAFILLLYGEHGPGTLVWLYPILAAVIFANEFKIGSILSTSFCLLVAVITLSGGAITLESLSADRFVISLFALCLLCNTSAYFYDKAVAYIQSLYREGIEDLAYFDQLTGLANRWSFENWAIEKLEEERHSNTLTAMIFLDIDDFKAINDCYGHDVGDRVLQHFSRRLKNNIRNKDRKTDKHDYSIARFAGDEFVLLLYGVKSRSDLEGILNRILHLFEDCYQGKEEIGKVNVSLGVALFPEDADTLAELTRCADKAMYSAKHSGKNQFHYYRKDRGEKPKKKDNVTPITQRRV